MSVFTKPFGEWEASECAQQVDAALAKLTDRTDRAEVYSRKGAVDISIIAEHFGYDLITLYQLLRDIFQERAGSSDYNYQGFRDLASRIQDHARLHPIETDLRDELVWDELPVLKYASGDSSHGYGKDLLTKFRLRLAYRRKLRQLEGR